MPEPAWWQRGAFTRSILGSFADRDGDGVGDLPGIGAHLDHLADLGVEAVWLPPRASLLLSTDPERGDADVDLNGFQLGPCEAVLLRTQEPG